MLFSPLAVRKNAYLLHDPKIIVPLPFFDYFISFNAVYRDTFELDLFPGGVNPHQIPSMGAAHRPTGNDLVSFREHVLNSSVQIRECSEICIDELPGLFQASDILIRFKPNKIAQGLGQGEAFGTQDS